MNRNRSNRPEHQIWISEMDALTIVCTLQTEERRRARGGIPPLRGLAELKEKMDLIANGQNCSICGVRTVETIEMPEEGDMESGPYTVEYPCHTDCHPMFIERWNAAEDAAYEDVRGIEDGD